MRLLLAIGLVLLVVAPSTAAAQAPDGDAPAGADPMWLPAEEWVMERWMPFDEDRLFLALGMNRAQVYVFLKAGPGNLIALARRQGVRTRGLAAHLLANRRSVSRKNRALLVARTRRMLSQRHLAEHVIGHSWHRWSLFKRPELIWGPDFRRVADEGVRIEGLWQRVGIEPGELRRRILDALAQAGRRGLAEQALSPWQERTIRRQDRVDVNTLFLPQQPRAVQSSAAAMKRSRGIELLCALP